MLGNFAIFIGERGEERTLRLVVPTDPCLVISKRDVFLGKVFLGCPGGVGRRNMSHVSRNRRKDSEVPVNGKRIGL